MRTVRWNSFEEHGDKIELFHLGKEERALFMKGRKTKLTAARRIIITSIIKYKDNIVISACDISPQEL